MNHTQRDPHSPVDTTCGHTRLDHDNLRQRGIDPATVQPREQAVTCTGCLAAVTWNAAGRCNRCWTEPVPGRLGFDLFTTEHLVALALRNIAATGRINYTPDTLNEYADALDVLALQRLHGPLPA